MNALAKCVAVAAALAVCTANAETFSATDPDGKITIMKAPCTKAGPWFAKWKAAKWFYRGKMYDACWNVVRNRGGQAIVIIDSDGHVSQIDPQHFTPDEGV